MSASDRKNADDLCESTSSTASSQSNENGTNYPSYSRSISVFISLGLSVLCIALDNSIITTAIPEITNEFHSLPDIAWYCSAYFLSSAALQLVFGKLYAVYSIKTVYISSLFVFQVGSLVCGIASSSIVYIFGRATAGMGAAGIFSGTIIIINNVVPLKRRPIFMGAVTSVYGAACLTGPILGGVFTTLLSWRWCFYINLPCGAVSFLCLVFFLQISQTKGKPCVKQSARGLQFLGVLLLLSGIISLFLALQWGGIQYPWQDLRVVCLCLLFVSCMTGFCFTQAKLKDMAMIPTRIFLNRVVWASCWFSACMGGATCSMMFYLPLWFQAVKGMSPIKSGLGMLPVLLSGTASTLITSSIVSITGHYAPFMILSTIPMSLGAGLLSTITLSSSNIFRIGCQVIFGAGAGMGFQQGAVAISVTLQEADVAVGAALLIFFQTIGGAVSVCICQNIFHSTFMARVEAATGLLLSGSLADIGATELQHLVPKGDLLTVLEAYNSAVTSAYYVTCAVSALSICGAVAVPWNSAKGRGFGGSQQGR